ncbi:MULTISPECIES: hypothetical protein [Bacteroides]|jgi:hypothetical protein|uniref:hypothetical protein n=1 Tax=Bacteroides TaxID=816 RepID=UPI001B3C92DD|nr:hypothetical protein [Bacteroides sp. 1001302B_160321_D4]
MKILVCLILFLLLLSSCLHRAPKIIYPACYGIEHNSVRDSLGIVLLDSSWVAFDTWDGATAWGPKEKQPYPYHTAKQVNYNNGTLYCEIDSYSNGEKYETVDGYNRVYLEIAYFYRPACSGPLGGMAFNTDTVGWYCLFNNSPGSTNISKAQADSIIKAWGIEE